MYIGCISLTAPFGADSATDSGGREAAREAAVKL